MNTRLPQKYLLAVAIAASAFTASAAQVRQYTVEGTYTAFEQFGDPTITNKIVSAIDGLRFRVTFDLDLDTKDSDPNADSGVFTRAVSNSFGAAGSFKLAPINNSCLEPSIDCLVKLKNNQFGNGFDEYSLSTGLLKSDSLNSLVGIPVATSYFISSGKVGLFDKPDLVGPTDVSSFAGRSAAAFLVDGGRTRANFILNLSSVSEGLGTKRPLTPVPEPEAYAMLLAGLGLMGAIARRHNAKKSS